MRRLCARRMGRRDPIGAVRRIALARRATCDRRPAATAASRGRSVNWRNRSISGPSELPRIVRNDGASLPSRMLRARAAPSPSNAETWAARPAASALLSNLITSASASALATIAEALSLAASSWVWATLSFCSASVTATCCSCSALVVFSTTSCSASTTRFFCSASTTSTFSFASESCWSFSCWNWASFCLATSRCCTGCGDLLGRLDRGDRHGQDLDPLLLAVLGQALDQVGLELLAVLAADELAARELRAADPAERPALGRDDLGDDLLVDRVAVGVLVVLDEHLGDLVGQDAELDHAVERDRESVGREEVHLGFLPQVEPPRPAIDQADPGLVGVEVIGPRLERLGLDAALAVLDEEDVGVLRHRAGEQRHDAAKARRDGHRVVQLDRLGIRVIRVASRLEDLAEDPLLARLGEDLAGRQVVAAEGDPDADLVAGHDELRADLPRPEVRVVEVPALGQDAVVGPARLDALVVGLPILGRRGQLHVGLELEPLPADQDGLLARAHLDLACVVNARHQPQAQDNEPAHGDRAPRPAPARWSPGSESTFILERIHE